MWIWGRIFSIPMVISVPLLEVPECAFMTPYNVCTKLIPKQNKKRWLGRRKVCAFSTAWDNKRLDSCLLNFHYQAMFDRWLFPTYEMLSKNKENTCFSNSEDDFRWQTPSNCLTQSYVSCGTTVGGKKIHENYRNILGKGVKSAWEEANDVLVPSSSFRYWPIKVAILRSHCLLFWQIRDAPDSSSASQDALPLFLPVCHLTEPSETLAFVFEPRRCFLLPSSSSLLFCCAFTGGASSELY